MKRPWIVPTVAQLPDGQVVPDPEATAAALLELQGMLQRLGGTVAIGTERHEVNGRVLTTALHIKYDSFVPMEQKPSDAQSQRKAQTAPPPEAVPETQPQPAPEPEPEEREPERLSREERVRAGSV